MQRFPNVRKGKWLKGLSVIDEHTGDPKPFRECDELDAKRYPEEKEYDFDKDPENDDITANAEYVKDIFVYLKSHEICFSIPNYLRQHPKITSIMRVKLVNWLVEITEYMGLKQETLYHGVKLFDMFMSKTHNAEQDELELIASAALMVASKCEERRPIPSMPYDYVLLSNNTLKCEDVTNMERILLRKIEFNVSVPLPYCFLRRYSRVTKAEGLNDMTTLNLARYILETSLLFLNFCRIRESLISAACFSLALRMRRLGDWTPTLQKFSGYSREDIEPMVWALNHMLIRSKLWTGLCYSFAFDRVTAVYRKYSRKIFHQVALIECLEDTLEGSRVEPPEIYLPENCRG